MKAELRDALAAKLLAMADDEMILGHRNSEWCGHAPILEEDIAFANIALDEMGHATVWYKLLADLIGEDRETFPDRLVFRRATAEFRCTQLVELPKGDWAFTMLRQYLFDAAESIWLWHLSQSRYQPLADAAAKIQKEEIYHLRHTSAWVKRLGLGTEESNRRMQTALNQLWVYLLPLFTPLPDETPLVEAGFIPEAAEVQQVWSSRVEPYLREAGLTIPAGSGMSASRKTHTENLAPLLENMQEVARQHPGARW